MLHRARSGASRAAGSAAGRARRAGASRWAVSTARIQASGRALPQRRERRAGRAQPDVERPRGGGDRCDARAERQAAERPRAQQRCAHRAHRRRDAGALDCDHREREATDPGRRAAAEPRRAVRRAAAGRCAPGRAARAASRSARRARRPAAQRCRTGLASNSRTPPAPTRASTRSEPIAPCEARQVREVHVVEGRREGGRGQPGDARPGRAHRDAVQSPPGELEQHGPRSEARHAAGTPIRALTAVATASPTSLRTTNSPATTGIARIAASTTSLRTQADQEHLPGPRRSIAMDPGSCVRTAFLRAGARARLSRRAGSGRSARPRTRSRERSSACRARCRSSAGPSLPGSTRGCRCRRGSGRRSSSRAG